jgi:hypothetical protein
MGVEPSPAHEIPDRRFLAVSHFLGHVHQQTTVAFINTAKQPAEASQSPSIFPTASPRDIVGRLPLGKVRQHRRFFAVVEELVAEEPGALLDVTLGEFLCFTEQTDAFSNYHVRYCHMIIYLPQQANLRES